jgi:hypothetical protein
MLSELSSACFCHCGIWPPTEGADAPVRSGVISRTDNGKRGKRRSNLACVCEERFEGLKYHQGVNIRYERVKASNSCVKTLIFDFSSFIYFLCYFSFLPFSHFSIFYCILFFLFGFYCPSFFILFHFLFCLCVFSLGFISNITQLA